MPNVTVFSFYLLVTLGYLLVISGYLVVTSGYFIVTACHFSLLLVTSRYFWFLVTTMTTVVTMVATVLVTTVPNYFCAEPHF